MQRKRTHSTIVLAAATAAASLAFGGQVSAQVIRITNANNHEIPLKAASSVQIDSAGNLLAECALDASNVCTQLSGGGGGTPPTATLTRTDTDTDVRVGETISFSWTSNNAEACKATSSPANSSFAGVRETGSTASVVPASVGTHTYTLVCYNADGASTASVQTVSVAQATTPPPPPDGCNLTSSTPGIQPTGWGRDNVTWSQLFTPPDGDPKPTYPNSNGFQVPIGASKGRYKAANFVANANETVSMFWDPAQAKPQEGYFTARPAQGMFISISPCAGDLRPADNNSGGGFEMGGCRKYANTGALTFTTLASVPQSTGSLCKLEAGKTYYINVLPANPNDGLVVGEHSCTQVSASSLGCDVQAKSSN